MKYSTRWCFVCRISYDYIIFDPGFCSSTIWAHFKHLGDIGALIDLMNEYQSKVHTRGLFVAIPKMRLNHVLLRNITATTTN